MNKQSDLTVNASISTIKKLVTNTSRSLNLDNLNNISINRTINKSAKKQIMKNLYGKETGDLVKSILSAKGNLIGDGEEIFPIIENKKLSKKNSVDFSINNIKKSIISKLELSPKRINQKLKDDTIQLELNHKIEDTPDNLNESKIGYNKKFNNLPIKFSFDNSISKSVNKDQNLQNDRKFYCPICQHCNQLKDEFFDDHLVKIKESKSIITKGLEHIIHSNILNDLESTKTNDEKNYFEVYRS